MTAQAGPVLVVAVGTSIADVPIVLSGTLDSAGLRELSGTAAIDKSLSSLLQGIGPGFAEAVERLESLIGGESGVLLQELAFDWNPRHKLAELALKIGAGSSGQCRFLVFKGFDENGATGAGFELQSTEPLPINPLRGLIGEITFKRLGIFYASADSAAREAGDRSGHHYSQGLSFSHEILVGGVDLLDRPAMTGPGESSSPAALPPERKPADEAPDRTTTDGGNRSFEVNKSIGPLSIKRIGLSYQAAPDQTPPLAAPKPRPRIGISLDAGLQLSFLDLTLDGLGLSYPIGDFDPHKIWDQLEFHLDGMGLAFSSGPIQIGGSLLRLPGKYLAFEGTLLVRTAAFSFSAFGAYAKVDETHSFYAYAVLLRALGGYPCFYVRGLAFGFGVNRRLRLPPIEEVSDFPLVAAAMGKPAFKEIAELPRALRPCVTPAEGSFWVAAGVKFTSFALVESFALLSVSFGTDVAIGLLGLSRVRVPPAPPGAAEDSVPALCCAELALRVEFNPSVGILSVEARLSSNSYVFARACRLTGGLAFVTWLKGEHEGDFVVSLGGYHPRFVVPSHYPAVPRLGIDWIVSREVRITGELYFAVTPSCLMAGGKLGAVYDGGWIKAWFIAYADFLIAWKPFHYDVAIGVSFGVSATLNIDLGIFRISRTFVFELGADLHLWGPPFAGTARIKFYIVSFTVSFGNQARHEPDPLSWDEFARSFLPGKDSVCTVTFTGGLLRECTLGSEPQRVAIVDPHGLAFQVQSQAPCTAVKWNGTAPEVAGTWAGKLGVTPMYASDLASELSVALVHAGTDRQVEPALFATTVVRKGFPGALWGRGKPSLSKPTSEVLRDVPTGVAFALSKQAHLLQIRHSLPAMPIKAFAYERIGKWIRWTGADFPREIDAPGENNTLSSTLWGNSGVSERRAQVLSALARVTPYPLNDVYLPETAAAAASIFQAEPTFAALGQLLPEER